MNVEACAWSPKMCNDKRTRPMGFWKSWKQLLEKSTLVLRPEFDHLHAKVETFFEIGGQLVESKLELPLSEYGAHSSPKEPSPKVRADARTTCGLRLFILMATPLQSLSQEIEGKKPDLKTFSTTHARMSGWELQTWSLLRSVCQGDRPKHPQEHPVCPHLLCQSGQRTHTGLRGNNYCTKTVWRKKGQPHCKVRLVLTVIRTGGFFVPRVNT